MASNKKAEKIKRDTIDTYNNNLKRYPKTKYMTTKDSADMELFLRQLRGRKILDAGSGLGQDAQKFVDLGCSVVGIDLSDKFLKESASNVPFAQFLKMDIGKLLFNNNSFHGIWACASFLHIPKFVAEETIRGFYRVLKNDGLLYINVEKGFGEKIVKNSDYKDDKRMIAFYEKEELESLLKKSKFKIITSFEDEDQFGWIRVFAKKPHEK